MRTHVPRLQERAWRRTIEMPAEIRAPLSEIAAKRERSVSAEIPLALREHVERHRWETWR